MMALGRQKFQKKEDEKLSKAEREMRKKEKRPALTDDYRKPLTIGNLFLFNIYEDGIVVSTSNAKRIAKELKYLTDMVRNENSDHKSIVRLLEDQVIDIPQLDGGSH